MMRLAVCDRTGFRCAGKAASVRALAAGIAILFASVAYGQPPSRIDLAKYQTDCQVKVKAYNGQLIVSWPAAENETAEVAIDLSSGGPIFKQMLVRQANGTIGECLAGVDPVWFLTVGSRKLVEERPAGEQWQVFFDNPHQRPHEVFPSKLEFTKASLSSSGQRATLRIEKLTAGPFTGAIEITFYAGSRLMRIDAVLQTEKDRLAMFYDEGLVARQPSWKELAWFDTAGKLQYEPVDKADGARPLKIRHRAIAVQGKGASLTCFPPPHQFQFPRDYSTNLGFAWAGIDYQGPTGKTGFGIRQHKDGGGNYVPWFNAPPGVDHRLGMFVLLSAGSAPDALNHTLKLTNRDRFPELPGHKTFTTHYHMAIAIHAMQERAKGIERTTPPDYVHLFKELGVNMVHLGEFHGDGHPKDPGPLRLPEMQAMFGECKRWSDEKLLIMPGEEGNDFLGLKLQGKHPGHWMCYFPRPVYWTMTRGADQPFVEEIAPYGKVYHVGGRADMIRLLKEEHGLAWSAHPRIKASNWTPDVFREEDFFIADYWLGGAWKAMPGDLSREKLGERVLDLLDDMANWGHKKYTPGEVDVFTIDPTHELYAHMNVNYMQLDRIPRYDESWQPVLDSLSNGRFFVTTGEVLIPKCTLGGKSSGDVLKITPAATDPELEVELRWTFPLSFAEIISGDGQKVHRERIDLTDTTAFGSRTLKLHPKLAGRRWLRVEAWDIAANGAFTQPIWIE